MNFFRDLFDHVQCLLRIIWEIVLMILLAVSIPILFFCPLNVTKNFDETVTKAALKTLWFIWRLIRALLLFTLVLVLFVLSPILWPIYCGIAFFWPGFVINLFSIKLF